MEGGTDFAECKAILCLACTTRTTRTTNEVPLARSLKTFRQVAIGRLVFRGDKLINRKG